MSEQKKVLIVEDDQILRNVITTKFTDSNFAVSVASHGTEGLSKAISEHPDVIIHTRHQALCL